MKYLLFAIGLILLTACQPAPDYKTLPYRGSAGINVVVEIPAGTNHKMEFQTESGTFANDQIDGQDRIIDFLPYPGNYGFIPSTFMDPQKGGDGDALDILVIGESVPTGSVIEATPIAALLLKDRGEIDTKIIAVPALETQRVFQADNFETFLIHYDAAKRIIEEWFLHYKGMGVTELVKWENETYAQQEIEKWAVK